eukprot:scaffold1428_cov98-Cylindrotheca_fusiformis.AAC.6
MIPYCLTLHPSACQEFPAKKCGHEPPKRGGRIDDPCLWMSFDVFLIKIKLLLQATHLANATDMFVFVSRPSFRCGSYLAYVLANGFLNDQAKR